MDIAADSWVDVSVLLKKKKLKSGAYQVLAKLTSNDYTLLIYHLTIIAY